MVSLYGKDLGQSGQQRTPAQAEEGGGRGEHGEEKQELHNVFRMQGTGQGEVNSPG